MMMVAASRDERGGGAEFLLKFKAEHAAIKFQRAFEVGDLQMDMADGDAGINGSGSFIFHAGKIAAAGASRE